MKLTIVLMFVFSVAIAAEGLPQQISYEASNVPLKKVFTDISKQTGYSFVYTASMLKKSRSVNFVATKVSLEQLLDMCFKDQPFTYALIDKMIVLKEKREASMLLLAAQPAITVSGKVQGQQGEPLAGATIADKQAGHNTVSKDDGSFKLTVSKLPVTLEISYVGYETAQVTVNAESQELQVKLVPVNASLNEVVVVGYGTQRKGELTSAVASVKSDNFIKGSVTDAGQLIQGKVAGLSVISPNGDPTGATQILLRGQTTLMGANQNPLILIDGIPGDLRTVAPQDIESVDVLKDGSAAAIYGTRGTNGVIIITTKKAGANSKTAVEYSAFLGTQTIARKLNLSTAADFRDQLAAGQRKLEMPDYKQNTDWLKAITRTPVLQSHNLTVRGGNATTNYLASVIYNMQEGIFKKSYNQLFSARADFNHSMFDNKLRINVNMFSSSRRFNGFNSNIYRQATLQNPTAPLTNPDGTWFQELTKFDYENPVSDLMESDGLSKELNNRYKGSIVFAPLKGLKLSAVFSYAKRQLEAGYNETKQHVSTLRDGRNGYARVNGDASTDRLMELTAEYARTVNRHQFTLLGGYSYQENDYNSNSTENWDFPTDRFGWNNIGLGRAISSGNFQGLINSFKSQTNLIGFFGRISYNYNQKYLLMASIRREEASQLWGTKNPWGMFPAVSAGWRISKENFMQKQRIFNDLKLRAGYGVTGSQPTDLFRGVAVIGYGGFVYSNGQWVQTLVPTQNANPDLRWEEKRETNIGLDFTLANNRISGTVDFYNRKIHNLLFLYDVPSPPNLYNQTLANVGTMQNKGVEVMLNFTAIKKKDFEWNTSVNFSTNSNKLISLSNDLYKTSTNYLQVGAIFPPIQTFSHLLKVGGPVGDLYGFKVIDINNNASDAANYGQWIYEGSDGKPVNYSELTHSFGDKKVIGNGLPRYYAGWQNNFRYKQWDLAITQRGAFKFQVANLQRMMLENPTQAQYNLLKTAYDPVYGKTQLKSPVEFNSYYIENGDYWKVDNITIGYTWKTTGAKYIQSARVYVSSLNTFIITGYKGIDPEVSLRNGTSTAQSGVAQTPTSGLDPGMDSPYKYPTTRTFSFGLNVTF
ncbi:SusC/RagA family TonB-linked outer membrane protein [Filimonas effusa]|nr:SusC/RagA family TonB-linked outer membrane protein [Filimonas effusa]